jgi:hypothetical protein
MLMRKYFFRFDVNTQSCHSIIFVKTKNKNKIGFLFECKYLFMYFHFSYDLLVFVIKIYLRNVFFFLGFMIFIKISKRFIIIMKKTEREHVQGYCVTWKACFILDVQQTFKFRKVNVNSYACFQDQNLFYSVSFY